MSFLRAATGPLHLCVQYCALAQQVLTKTCAEGMDLWSSSTLPLPAPGTRPKLPTPPRTHRLARGGRTPRVRRAPLSLAHTSTDARVLRQFKAGTSGFAVLHCGKRSAESGRGGASRRFSSGLKDLVWLAARQGPLSAAWARGVRSPSRRGDPCGRRDAPRRRRW